MAMAPHAYLTRIEVWIYHSSAQVSSRLVQKLLQSIQGRQSDAAVSRLPSPDDVENYIQVSQSAEVELPVRIRRHLDSCGAHDPP